MDDWRIEVRHTTLLYRAIHETPPFPYLRLSMLSYSNNHNRKGTYDYATIHALVNECPVLHVSFTDPEHDFPVVLPMLGCTGSFSNPAADANTTEQDIYIHGYVSGRIFKSSKNAAEGLPITVAATFLDGLVLSLTPFHNSCNYRSAVVYGYASLVEDTDEVSQPSASTGTPFLFYSPRYMD